MLIGLTLGLVAILTFKRYFPVLGLKCMKWGEFEIKNQNINVIDVRDYNVSYKNPIPGAINIPIAYLNRYYSEIPKVDLYIVASDTIEKNIGIRLLRSKGYQIVGCSIRKIENKLVHENKSVSNC
jgi:rhodanese-related sulfurtransferase